MATHSERLELPIDREGARSLCREVVRGMGWSWAEDGDIVVSEDGSRLHCHCHPAVVRVGLRPRGERTEATFDGWVPGWGPISSKHVREQTRGLARRVGLACIERPEAPAPS